MGSATGGTINNSYGVVGVRQLCRNKNSVSYPARYFLNLVRSADRALVFYFLFHALIASILKHYFILWSCLFRKETRRVQPNFIEKLIHPCTLKTAK